MTDQIILSATTKNELIQEIGQFVLSGVSTLFEQNRKTDLNSKEWLTTKETESILKISNVTRWNWTNAGILKSYKIGNRLRYRKDEVLAAVLKIESKHKF